MSRRLALVVVLLLPSLSWAQAAPEKALPAQSQLYFRFDGMRAHQQAFHQTVAGKMLDGELGEFLQQFGKYVSGLLQQVAQNNDPQIAAYLGDALNLVHDLHQNGLVLAVEVQQVNPPAVHAVLLLPKSGGETGTLLPLLQKVMETTKAPVRDARVGKRFVHQFQAGPVHIGWWGEGDDALIYAGTEEPAAYARNIDAGKTGLENHPLYRKVRSFQEFTTASRGYLDFPAVARVASDISPAVAQLVDELGLRNLGSLTFVSGFDGPAQRSVSELETPGPRKGLMSMSGRKTLRLKDLPALPNDVTSLSASTMDLSKSYDVIVQLIQGGVKIFAPAFEDTAKEGIKTIEALLGVDLRRDVFDTFGTLYVSYSSSSEGILGVGSLSALQVKDGRKLVDSLERMTRAAGFIPGVSLDWKKADYKGGQLLQLYLKFGESTSLVGSFGTYQNWFLYSQFPQPVKGFIMRANRELPTWQPEDKLLKVLAQYPGEYTSISISDPRPGIQGLLALAPFVLNITNSVVTQLVPGSHPFDISLIPHAQEMTLKLFPNVTIGTDDGRVIRSDTRASIAFP